MAAVLVAGAMIQCSHGFPVKVTASQSELTAGGQAVLLASDVQQGVPSCTFQKPCKSILAITAGVSTVLSVGGKPVVTVDAMGTTDAGTFMVTRPGQTALDSK